MVKVDSKPGGPNDQHWVRALSIDDKDGKIMDPWQVPGKELTVLSRYFAEGWTPEKAIFISVVYRMASGREVIDPHTESLELEGSEHQPEVCVMPGVRPFKRSSPRRSSQWDV